MTPQQHDAQEPLSPMAEDAVVYHEVFCAFVSAGFTEDQALTLVARTLAATSEQI